MKTMTIDEAIKAAFQEEESRVPARHRLRTDACPPLTRFGVRLRDWSPEQRAHLAAGCAYCERMIATSWGIEPPGANLLIDYALGSRSDLARSMEAYLAEHRALKAALSILSGIVPRPHQNVNRIFVGPEFRLAAAAKFASEAQERLHLAGKSDDGTLLWTLDEVREGTHHVLEARVDDQSGKCRKVRLSLVPSEGPELTVDIPMHDAGEFGTVGRYEWPYAKIAGLGQDWIPVFDRDPS